MSRHMHLIPKLLATVLTLAFASAAPVAWAEENDEEIPFDEAEIFFELNDTDDDLGIHAKIDGEPWKRLVIEDPNERKLLNIRVQGRLRRQGLTEIFFESAEPNFEEFSAEEFFTRFLEGTYEIEGKTLDGKELESETEVTHTMPAPVGNFTINGMPARPDSDECDEENLPEISNPIMVEWDVVTQSHPDLGNSGEEIEVVNYEVVSEYENEDEQVFSDHVVLEPMSGLDRYSMTLSEEFFVDGTEVKFEVLVREESFNQTASESCPFEFVGVGN